MRSGQVADRAGVNPQTLRYYERRGLLPMPGRTTGGHRVYPPETVMLLRVIKAAQRLGFSLGEVEELLGVGRHRTRRRALPDLASAKVAEVDARIADLQLLRADLVIVLEAGCHSAADCRCGLVQQLPFPRLAASQAAHDEAPRRSGRAPQPEQAEDG